jgi:DNA-binding transcriptional LysR family regulator
LARRPHVAPADLAGAALVVTESGCSYRELFLRTLADAGVRPPSVVAFESVEAVKHCVMAGMGVTLLPAVTVTHEVAAGRLAAVRWVGPEYQLMTQLVRRDGQWISPAMRAAVRLLRDMVGEASAVAVDTG